MKYILDTNICVYWFKGYENIEKLKEKLFVVESNDMICEMFGKIKVELINKGDIIDDADIFIAACALTEDAIAS